MPLPGGRGCSVEVLGEEVCVLLHIFFNGLGQHLGEGVENDDGVEVGIFVGGNPQPLAE